MWGMAARVSIIPWKMLEVPRVTIIVERRNWWMRKALMQPNPTPIAPARRKASGRLPSKRSSSRTVTYMATVAMAGKDRSIPPESITTNTPIAMVPMIELLFRMSNMFSAVKNEPLTAFTSTE